MPTRKELKQLQSLPLEVKIKKSQQRIREWVEYYGEDGVYVSFSGGKDSRKYMKNEDLEPKKAMQKIILDTIVAYIQKFGYPPTVREIGEIVGLKSSSSVYRHLKALEEQGFIINDGMPRAISVVGWKFVKEGKENATIKSNH